MSLLRKTFCLAFVLSISLSNVNVFAQSEGVEGAVRRSPGGRGLHRGTQYSYNPSAMNFCDSQAQSMMEKLNASNQAQMTRLEEIKNVIKEKEAYVAVLSGLIQTKNSYLTSLTALTRSRAQGNVSGTLDNLKSTVKNGLLLNAIKLLMDQRRPNMAPVNPRSGGRINNSQLDAPLNAFKNAFTQAGPSNKEELASKVREIIASIPPSISPSVILNVLEQKAPEATRILYSSISKETIMNCISTPSNTNSEAACKEIADNDSKTTALSETIRSQLTAATNELQGSQLSSAIDEGIQQNISSFNAGLLAYKNRNAPGETSEANNSSLPSSTSLPSERLFSEVTDQSLQKAVEVNLQGMDKFFYVQPVFTANDPIANVEAKFREAFKNAKDNSERWMQTCGIVTSDNQEYCQNTMNTISPKVELLKSDFIRSVSSLQTEMNTIQNSPLFSNNEILKKYIAEKYLRTCNPVNVEATNADIVMGFKYKKDNGTYGCINARQESSSLENLNSSVLEIIRNTKYYTKINTRKTGDETFSPAELADFNRACKNERTPVLQEVYGTICPEIVTTVKKIQEIPTPEKLEQLNRESWIVSDDRSASGYRRIAKKSNLRIIGEGVLPSIPVLIPAWLGNFQVKQNIEMLTAQAMFNKQVLYSQSVFEQQYYNAWNGFQYNPFGTSFATTTPLNDLTRTGF